MRHLLHLGVHPILLANKGKCRRLDRIGDIESLPDITRALGQRLLSLPSKLGVCPVNLSNA